MLLTWPVSGRDGQVQNLSVWSSSVLHKDLFLSRENRLPFALLKQMKLGLSKKELFCSGPLSTVMITWWKGPFIVHREHELERNRPNSLAFTVIAEKTSQIYAWKVCNGENSPNPIYRGLNPIFRVHTYFPMANPIYRVCSCQTKRWVFLGQKLR